MLSGETAAGQYPVLAVKAMSRIAETAEDSIDYVGRFRQDEFVIQNETDALSHSTCGMAIDLNAKAIVACTLSGLTARMVSRFRAPIDIIGLTTEEKTWRQLALSWGVIPEMCELYPSTEVLFFSAKKIAAASLKLTKGDTVVITGGITNGQSGNTNLIKIEHV
jgi:pyruvate kinase